MKYEELRMFNLELIFRSQPNSAEERERMIETLEKTSSHPEILFLICSPLVLIAGASFGLYFSLVMRGGWRCALEAGIPFGFAFLLIMPVMLQSVLPFKLAALKNGESGRFKINVLQILKSKKLVGCCALALALTLLLEGSLVNGLGIRHDNNALIDKGTITLRDKLKAPIARCTLFICNLVVKVNPTLAKVHELRGDIYMELAEYQNALESYTTTVSLNPNLKEAYKGRACAYIYLDQNIKAIDDCTRCIGLDHSDSVSYYDRGLAYDRLKQPSKAADDYSKAINLYPNCLEYYETRADCYLRLKQYKKALDDYNKSISLSPKDPSLYVGRAGYYLSLKQYQNAIDDCNIATSIDNDLFCAHCYRGRAYWSLKQFNNAIDDFSKTIAIDPKHGCYLARAGVYSDMGQYQNAIADCDAAIKLNFSIAEAYVTRGDIYSKIGQNKKAIADYTQAIAIDPKCAEPYHQRAESYRKLGLTKLSLKDKSMADKLGYTTKKDVE
jgi:tetratricopeptide (TPR) repeat protein